MDFQLTDDQKMIQETAASFVKKESPVERMRKLAETERGWDPGFWKQMGELGWLGLAFPESVGGFGGGLFDASLVLEPMGASLVPEPYVASAILAGRAALHAGDASQQKALIEPMLEGDSTLALAYAERASRYDPIWVEAKADKSGDGYRLTGEKVFVLNGHAADRLLISARTGGSAGDEEGISLFFVERDRPGLDVRSVRTMDGGRAAVVRFEGLELPAAQRLGEEGAAGAAILRAVDEAEAATCAEGLGVARTVLEMTVEYLKTRKQFGVPIGVFQALQHRAVDMFIQVELLKGTSILANTRGGSDDREIRARAVSTAKAQLARGGFFVVAQGTQLHGGIGVTDEHDISLFFKRMRSLVALFGDEAHHIERFASLPSFVEGVGSAA